MRILQVMAGAPHGGAETFFVSLARALARAGVEQRAVIRPHASRRAALEAAGIPVRELPFHRRLDFSTRRGLRRAAAEFRPDVALTWMSRATAMMPAGPSPIVARLGGFYDIGYYRRADHLVCNTASVRDHVLAQGWPTTRISVIPNFAALVEAPAVDRAAFETPEGAPLFVALGRLHPNKGFDVLLRALAGVPDAHLWLAGEGPERSRLEDLAESLGIGGRVRFLGWREDAGALLAAADAAVISSRVEPFGNVMAEAWAAGTPLVTTDAEGPREWVAPGSDALMVPREDAEALAGAMRELAADPEIRRRLATAGRRRHAEDFAEDACVRDYLDLFERAIARRQNAANAT